MKAALMSSHLNTSKPFMHVRSNSSPAIVFSYRILRGNPNILVIYHQVLAQLKFR